MNSISSWGANLMGPSASAGGGGSGTSGCSRRASAPLKARYTRTVAIVGAGASGTLTAIQLLRNATPDDLLEIRLVDPSSDTGRGVAYSTTANEHLLNVPAAKMSAFPDEPGHFLRWLADRGTPAEPPEFVPRKWFGDYLETTLQAAAATSHAKLIRVYEQVVELTEREPGYTVRLSSGRRFRAATVVLAMGSPRSDRAWAPVELLESDRFIADPWVGSDIDDRCRDAGTIVLVGTGLTMVDVALTLTGKKSAAPRPTLRAVSRRGLLPRAHRLNPAAPASPPDIPDGPLSLSEARDLISAHISEGRAECGDWRPAFDSLRPITNELWSRLSPEDKREFMTTDVRQWDVLRHRMAPESAASINELRESGELVVHCGSIAATDETEDTLVVTLSGGEMIAADVVIDCTGPALMSEHAGTGELLLSYVMSAGLVRPHELDTGLDVSDRGAAIRRDGTDNANLLVIGPTRRGSLWETTAIPEIRVQAQELAVALTGTKVTPPRRSLPVHDLYDLQLSTTADAANF